MKKKYLLMPFLFVLVLVSACGKKEEKSAVTKKETSSVVSSSKTQTSTTVLSTSGIITSTINHSGEMAASTANTVPSVSSNASYNGSYYSVQGKYGEVIIVNKKHPIAASYAPGEDPTALAAFQQLVADMQAKGFAVSNGYSGFRSYDTQATIYNSYLASDSQTNVDTYSARPGYSEHQTGLAFDLLDSSGQLLTETQAATWLANHAHEYGFIVRYLPGKEVITGYMAESWHVRYIGQEATDIYQSGKTLEEYYGVAGGNYAQ